MTEKEFICVVCPNGCSINAVYDESVKPVKLISAKGFRCPRGEKWIRQEIENPLRTFSTSVTVKNGDFIEASVRLTKPIPLSKVFDVMSEIKDITLTAPVSIGDVVLTNPAGCETQVIVTRNVAAVK